MALLLRTNFLESAEREPFFAEHPFARMWVPSLRLPMMHRHGWAGPQAPSNTCFAWFVWDEGAETKGTIGWFDWRDLPAVRQTGAHINRRAAPAREAAA